MAKRKLVDEAQADAAKPQARHDQNLIKSLRKQLAARDKIIDEQNIRIERQGKDRFVIPRQKSPRKTKGGFVRAIIPDTHGCFVDPDALAAMLEDLRLLAPKEIVLLGDHLDCGGFLSQHHTLGYVAEAAYTFDDDVDAGNDMLDRVQAICPKADIHYLEGNHECLSPDHDVLTKEGWKPIEDVTTDDVVAGMSDDGSTQWSKPLASHCYEYEGDMISYDGPIFRIRMTPQHRVWYWNQPNTELSCRKAWKIASTTTTYEIPTASNNTQPEYEINDNEIRLVAWILTDGTLSSNKVEIYQSKSENFNDIRSIFDELDLAYSEGSRERGGDYRPEHKFYVLGNGRDRVKRLFGIKGKCCKSDKTIPPWVKNLSARQFDIFIETIIQGDGSKRGDAACIYGEEHFLEELQSMIVVNGRSCSMRKKYNKQDGNFSNKGWHFCLNVCKRNRRKVAGGNFKSEEYSGMVYCLTTESDNFFVRHRGNVSVTGNSRIEKWCVTQALRNSQDAQKLLNTFGTETQLHLAKRKIKFYKQGQFYDGCRIPSTIKLGRCYFTHGSRVGKNATQAMLGDYGACVVFGHVHKIQSASSRTVEGGEIGAWTPGCLCRLQPLWRHTSITDWSHGYGVQLVRPDGDFLHITVPIIDGKSYLLNLTSMIKQ